MQKPLRGAWPRFDFTVRPICFLRLLTKRWQCPWGQFGLKEGESNKNVEDSKDLISTGLG